MTKQPRVFVSHANEDSPYALRLEKLLQEAGVFVYGSVSARPGTTVFDSLRDDLKASDLVVFVVPAREGEGRWALAEMGAARALDKKIVGVIRDPARFANSSVARSLSGSALIDASELSPAALTRTIVASVPLH